MTEVPSHNYLAIATTNQKGKAELKPNTGLTSGENTFYFRKGDTSTGVSPFKSITITPLDLVNLGVSVDDLLWYGNQIPIVAQITANTDDLSDYELEFTGAVEGTYTTDEVGQVEVGYIGEGAGETSVTVTAGNWTKTKTFKDLIQYWDVNNNNSYIEYVDMNRFEELSQGYSLDSTNNILSYVAIGSQSLKRFYAGNWELTFKMVSSKTFTFVFGGYSIANGSVEMALMSVTPTVNDNIILKYENGLITLKQNTTTLQTINVGLNKIPYVGAWNSSFIFNKLKFGRL